MREQERGQNRSNKGKSAGGNTATSQSKMDESKAKLAEAKNLLPTITASFGGAVTLEKTSEGVQKIQEATKAVHEKIKESHALLVESINSLKGLKGASTTPTAVLSDSGSVE